MVKVLIVDTNLFDCILTNNNNCFGKELGDQPYHYPPQVNQIITKMIRPGLDELMMELVS